ncbi:MAG TPA: hypothetical protein VK750_01595, partial [Cytophagaceae bacterium]|nr:hypothetical protein [Cytophagaceae bacterium]
MYTRRGWRKYSLLFICFFTFIFTYGQNSLNKNASQLKALRFQTDQYKSQKHYPQYINTLFQLKRQYEEHKDFSSLAYILSEIGDVYFQWGVYEKAVDYYERASDPSYAQYLSSSDQRTIALKTADANRLLGSYTKAQNNYVNIYKRWGLDLSEK